MFKWACFILAVIIVAVLGWMLNELRLELKDTATAINTHLPAILEATENTTSNVAVLSEDVREFRDLSRTADAVRDKTLVTYADNVLDLIEPSDAQIGLEKKLLGSGLKKARPAAEWAATARKEALWLVLRVKSRDELLDRLCKNKFGSDWYIELPGAEPLRLRDWVVQKVPEEVD